MHLTDTDWWHDLMHGIYGPRQGGARIIIDAEGASTGVGKTGLAVYLAKLCSEAFGYKITPDDVTLSGEQYLDRWREHPGPEQPSVIILDELAGAGAGDARRSDVRDEPPQTLTTEAVDEAQGVSANQGVNARRAMASSTIDAIGNVAANRMRAMTLIIVSQNIKWLDKNLLDLVDCWIRIRQEPSHPDGPEATAYELYTSDMDFESRQTKTPAITDLTWSDIPDDDPDYQEMERMKDEATSAATEEAPQELPVELRNEKIEMLVDAGIQQKEVADAFDLDPSTISKIVNS